MKIIEKRLAGIKRIIAVSGGKGGVGKSLTASVLALTLSRLGHRVGLLDLDLSAPSLHVILGIEGLYPKEEKGIIPPEVHGVEFMSIVYFIEDLIGDVNKLLESDFAASVKEIALKIY